MNRDAEEISTGPTWTEAARYGNQVRKEGRAARGSVGVTVTDSKRIEARLRRAFALEHGRSPSVQEGHNLRHMAEDQAEAERYDSPAPGSTSSESESESRTLWDSVGLGGLLNPRRRS